jgi:hypothetical protein
MARATTVSDVRSILRRSLPDSVPAGNDPAERLEGPQDAEPSRVISASTLERTFEIMHTLQTASVLSRLLPGMPLILLGLPGVDGSAARLADMPEPLTIDSRPSTGSHSDHAGNMRASLADSFSASVPAAAEALLSELGVIERQDRAYYRNESHNEDASAAYQYRQRRKADILAEILELRKHMPNRL